MRKHVVPISCLAGCLSLGSPVLGATLYANVTASGTGDCSSWTNACTLSNAITNANTSDEIWAHAGTYGPISLKNGVKIIGGFDGTEISASESDPAMNVTIIDGGGTARCVSSSNHAPSTMLRGFVVKNGYDNSFDGGGGIRLTDSSAVLAQCVFENNTATWWGGAVAIDGTGSPEFINCTFHDNGGNGTTLAGAAVFLHSGSPKFTNCLFYDNKSAEGAVLANRDGTPTFINCTAANNEATIGKGGAINDEAARAVLRNCILWGNTAANGDNQIHNVTGSQTTVTYSDVQGGWSGTGNINSDPKFQDESADNYKILSTSPCKNTGSNSYLPLDVADVDWDGNTTETLPWDLASSKRTVYSVVDMGSYEYAECFVPSDCPSGNCCNNNCEECCDNDDCGPLEPFCRMSDHTCVRCLTDADCQFGCCKADNTCGSCGGGQQ